MSMYAVYYFGVFSLRIPIALCEESNSELKPNGCNATECPTSKEALSVQGT